MGDMSDIIRRPVLAQTHLSTQEAPSLAEARLHGPQQHTGRPGRAQAPHAEGQVAARGLSRPRPFNALSPTSMRKELRLRRRRDFDAVFGRGRAWHNELLVLRALPNSLEHNRYGFVTPKRLGGAVVRNRLRRRLRESIRVLPTRCGWDVVVSPKAPATAANFQQLNRAVVDLLVRAAILEEGSPAGETSV
jgi:ribonuclease P protein component